MAVVVTHLHFVFGAKSGTYCREKQPTHDGKNDLDLTYNYLNLTQQISKNNDILVNYSYLSDGTKLSAADATGNGRVYRGSLVYRKQAGTLTLESAAFGAGRFVATSSSSGTTCRPDYFITDHLGSVRQVVDETGNILEQNDYYPFGLRWNDPASTRSDNRFGYNAKEWRGFLNIPYNDHGARMLEPRYRMSWNGPDPIADETPDVSPFAFCNSNPIRFVDLTGLSAQPTEPEPSSSTPIEPVVVTAKRETNMPLWGTTISFGVTINHTYLDDVAKNGQFIGQYNNFRKEYSIQFQGNKQMPATTVAAQKASFAKKLKILKRLKRVFTVVGAVDGAKKAKDMYDKLISGKEVSGDEIYDLVSAGVSFAGWQGAALAISADLQKLATENALKILEETGNEELFFKIIQPGPRNY